MRRSIAPAVCALAVSACGTEATAPSLVCGSGTHLDGATCVANQVATDPCAADPVAVTPAAPPPVITCGAGTALDGTTCVVADPVTCGTGTERIGDACVGTLRCGTGTAISGDVCVSTVNAVTCGEGTIEEGGRCRADGSAFCGSGTAWNGSACALPAPIADTDLGAFLASPSLKTSYYLDTSYVKREHRFIVTNLSQYEADHWTEDYQAPFGTGEALHFVLYEEKSESLAEPTTFDIKDMTDGAGHCATIGDGAYDPYGGRLVVNLFSWQDLQETPEVCAVAGYLTVQLDPADTTRIVFRFDWIRFSDGTELVEKEFSAPYRSN